MNSKDHKERHEFLHQMLDELVADFIRHTHKFPSKTTVMELMEWSALQIEDPTSKGVNVKKQKGKKK